MADANDWYNGILDRTAMKWEDAPITNRVPDENLMEALNRTMNRVMGMPITTQEMLERSNLDELHCFVNSARQRVEEVVFNGMVSPKERLRTAYASIMGARGASNPLETIALLLLTESILDDLIETAKLKDVQLSASVDR